MAEGADTVDGEIGGVLQLGSTGIFSNPFAIQDKGLAVNLPCVCPDMIA